MVFSVDVTKWVNSVLCNWLDIWKSKWRPRWRKESSSLTQGTNSLLMKSFGWIWADFEETVLIPKVQHLSTRIIISAHWHQIVKRCKGIWLSCSCPLITAASSANWNQWVGVKDKLWTPFKQKPSWQNFSDLICWMKALQHILNKRRLRQSLCSTSRSTVIYGVVKSDVIIEVWKPLHRLFTNINIWGGIWWYFRTSLIRLWW